MGIKQIMDMHPGDTKPFLLLGNIYEELDEVGEALKYLKMASEIDPEAPVFHNKMIKYPK